MNRKILFMMCLFFAFKVQAGNAGPSQEQMEALMKQAQEMQNCMAKLDQSAMETLMARGEKLLSEVKQLCAADKRDEAQQTAIDYAREIATSKEMQAMQQCSELARNLTQQLPLNAYTEGSNRHICDEL